MKREPLQLPSALQQLVKDNLNLLQPENLERRRDTLQLRLSGYTDVMYLISDIVKVAILALGDGENSGHPGIPDPAYNVSGILSIILDLIPLEEANLLDQLRWSVLDPAPLQHTEEDWDFLLRSVSLLPLSEINNS